MVLLVKINRVIVSAATGIDKDDVLRMAHEEFDC